MGLLKLYIIHARTKVNPKLGEVDMDRLAHFYKDLRAEAFRSGGSPLTVRHIDGLIRLAEANARLELRQHVEAKDVDNAIGTVLESFIQSQKHSVAEELRKKFRRYIAQATPVADQFMALLERVFRERVEQTRLARGVGAEVDISEVVIPLAEINRQIEFHDFDRGEADQLMRSDRFRQTFRIDDNNLYRIVA